MARKHYSRTPLDIDLAFDGFAVGARVILTNGAHATITHNETLIDDIAGVDEHGLDIFMHVARITVRTDRGNTIRLIVTN